MDVPPLKGGAVYLLYILLYKIAFLKPSIQACGEIEQKQPKRGSFHLFSALGDLVTRPISRQALETAKSNDNGKPKLIVCKTIIGKGIDAVAGTNAAHGEAGVAYTDESRASIGLPEEKWFVSEDTRSFFKSHAASLAKT